MLDAYIATALTLADENPDAYNRDALAPEAIRHFRADIDQFIWVAGKSVPDFETLDPDQVAHDFWLTRNRHGAGFWDGDYSEPAGSILTAIAHAFGECNLYLGDDGLIYSA